MSAIMAFSRCFTQPVMARGYDYYRRNSVHIASGTDIDVHAQVQGENLYEIQIRREEDQVQVYCDCPYFIDQAKPCKHLWATVLKAVEMGHLQDVVPPRGLKELDMNALLVPMEEDFRTSVFVDEATAQNHKKQSQPEVSPWPRKLESLLSASGVEWSPKIRWVEEAEILYLWTPPEHHSRQASELIFRLCMREPRKTGGWKVPQPLHVRREEIAQLPDAVDRELLAMIAGGRQEYGHYDLQSSITVQQPLAGILVPRILATGRCYLSASMRDLPQQPLRWDGGDAWDLVTHLDEKDAKNLFLEGYFQRGEERLPISSVLSLYKSGFLVTPGFVAKTNSASLQPWIAMLQEEPGIDIPREHLSAFLQQMMRSRSAPQLKIAQSLGIENQTLAPTMLLRIDAPRPRITMEPLHAQLLFAYGGQLMDEEEKSTGAYDEETRCWMLRDSEAEQRARAVLMELGAEPVAKSWQEKAGWRIAAGRFADVVHGLMGAQWRVLIAGKTVRAALSQSARVSSGVDWFDLSGKVDYGEETTADLPQLLAALKRGEKMIELKDGSFGLLPEAWLQRFAMLGAMGTVRDTGIRFARPQAVLLDALLATQPAIDCDAAFRQTRQRLKRFEKIQPVAQPAGFRGTLRDYQRDGLAWMQFLAEFSFGGCLADDMGLGKTAQVLALLEKRRFLRQRAKVQKPSLVVVPRSLVFNWQQEAARFTPKLRVLDYSGNDRTTKNFDEHDLILTTYGTLRRDVETLGKMEFDYVILDEAQAIKNAQTDSARSVRLLQADHRLALSGTPVENHLGELWSIFAFLNPGFAGTSRLLQQFAGLKKDADEVTWKMLSHALRPFILRRTKQAVARDLPQRTEQTIYFHLEPRERKYYDQLRQHYRQSLLPKISKNGMAKNKIQVLEALLRLRQAACHPGLIDLAYGHRSSSKLDVLFEQLRDVMSEGHKALVFSQFTSLLALVRKRLDVDGVDYEYLDGKTRDRQAHVARFQTEAHCGLFLISLKAGGVGLNLTAADYVFILDPWWNPAAEAQAIDRTHRIGQTRQIFAYRLIARNTVEEKILALQKSKRQLADAILGASGSMMKDLGREEIEMLLS